MPKLIIENLPPYDGSYDLELTTFTGRELHLIKEISGVRAGELFDATQAGDYDLVVAFTIIVLRRAGTTVNPDEIMDAEVGAITIQLDAAAEEDERPPASTVPSGTDGGETKNSPDGDASEPSPSATSGAPSSTAGDPPLRILAATGSPSSENSESDQATGQEASAI